MPRREPTESEGKDAESATPLERFKDLTKGLLGVPLAEVRAIEREERRPRKPRPSS